jgi:hypothetical protein
MEYTTEQIITLWPSGRQELLGFANHLEQRSAAITAAQIRLAIEMADREFKRLNQDKKE